MLIGNLVAFLFLYQIRVAWLGWGTYFCFIKQNMFCFIKHIKPPQSTREVEASLTFPFLLLQTTGAAQSWRQAHHRAPVPRPTICPVLVLFHALSHIHAGTGLSPLWIVFTRSCYHDGTFRCQRSLHDSSELLWGWCMLNDSPGLNLSPHHSEQRRKLSRIHPGQG